MTSKTYRDFKNEAIQYNKAKEQFRTIFNTWLEKPAHLEEFTWNSKHGKIHILFIIMDVISKVSSAVKRE
jgi:hypothetical protein